MSGARGAVGFTAVWFVACRAVAPDGASQPEPSAPTPAPCATAGAPTKAAAASTGAHCPSMTAAPRGRRVALPALNEASGLAASRLNRGVLWVHNDSGDSARVFAINLEGEHLATVDVQGAAAVDWEDMELGPGPEQERQYLYIGDIGDNLRHRDQVVVYRAEEPQLDLDERAKRLRSVPAAKLELKYPDAPHDAEALLVDPREGSLVIVTKERRGPASLFEVDLSSFETGHATMRRAGQVRLPSTSLVGGQMVTAGTVSSDGEWVFLKTYTAGFLWQRKGGKLSAVFRAKPCRAALAFEPQGETVAFLGDGIDYVTLSEGVGQPLHVFRSSDSSSDSTSR